MSPDAQRIAIAEACGWRKVEVFEWTEPHDSGSTRKPKQWIDVSNLPDYLNDLNAMHEAEKVLTRPQQEERQPRTHSERHFRLHFQNVLPDVDGAAEF